MLANNLFTVSYFISSLFCFLTRVPPLKNITKQVGPWPVYTAARFVWGLVSVFFVLLWGRGVGYKVKSYLLFAGTPQGPFQGPSMTLLGPLWKV